jgi:hypothetical protein
MARENPNVTVIRIVDVPPQLKRDAQKKAIDLDISLKEYLENVISMDLYGKVKK